VLDFANGVIETAKKPKPKEEKKAKKEPKAEEPKADEPKADEPKAVAEAPVDAEVVEENPKAPTDEVSVPEKQEEESKGE
jgi:hypothetical protein